MLTYRSGLCFKIKRFTDPLDQNWVLAFIRKSYSPLVTGILLSQVKSDNTPNQPQLSSYPKQNKKELLLNRNPRNYRQLKTNEFYTMEYLATDYIKHKTRSYYESQKTTLPQAHGSIRWSIILTFR